MKLYNLYEGLILESVGNTIDKLLDGEYSKNGKKFFRPVEIQYRSVKSGGQLSTRQVMIYGIGTLKSGNEAIRVFQPFGDTQSSNSTWKTLLVNNITKITVKDFKYYMQPSDVSGGSNIPDYVGPQDKSFENNKLRKHLTF